MDPSINRLGRVENHRCAVCGGEEETATHFLGNCGVCDGIRSPVFRRSIVHSLKVKWYRDSLRLDNTEKVLMETRGSRHSLIIHTVEEKDFTNYTCQADNSQGRTRKHLLLSGTPLPITFKSQSTEQARDSFNISMSVNSFSPIEMYKLYYRRAPPEKVDEKTNPTKKPTNKYNPSILAKEWTEAIIPGDKDEKTLTHEVNFLIRKLEHTTSYVAKAQARNRYGWSKLSEVFKFKTMGIDLLDEEELSRLELRQWDVSSYEALPQPTVRLLRTCIFIYLAAFEAYGLIIRIIPVTNRMYGISLDVTPEPCQHMPEVVMRDLGVTAKDSGWMTTAGISTAFVLVFFILRMAA